MKLVFVDPKPKYLNFITQDLRKSFRSISGYDVGLRKLYLSFHQSESSQPSYSKVGWTLEVNIPVGDTFDDYDLQDSNYSSYFFELLYPAFSCCPLPQELKLEFLQRLSAWKFLHLNKHWRYVLDFYFRYRHLITLTEIPNLQNYANAVYSFLYRFVTQLDLSGIYPITSHINLRILSSHNTEHTRYLTIVGDSPCSIALFTGYISDTSTPILRMNVRDDLSLIKDCIDSYHLEDTYVIYP